MTEDQMLQLAKVLFDGEVPQECPLCGCKKVAFTYRTDGKFRERGFACGSEIGKLRLKNWCRKDLQ